MVYLGEEIRKDYNFTDITINRLKTLIQNYKELINERGNFVDKTPEEKKKSREILQAIKDVLTELIKIQEFGEKAAQLRDICEDIIKRYNSLHENDIEIELEEIDDFINSYNSKPHYTSQKHGEIKENMNQASKDTFFNLVERDEQRNREYRNKQDKIELSNDIDGLINAVNTIIEKFSEEYNLSIYQVEQETVSFQELMPVTKKSWIKTFWLGIINRLKAFFGNKTQAVIDVPYQELDNKKEKFYSRLHRLPETIIPEERVTTRKLEDNSTLKMEEIILDDNDLYEELDKIVSKNINAESHIKLYNKMSNLSGNSRSKAYSGRINNTHFLVNDQKTPNGSMTIIKMDDRYFEFKVIDGKIEYIEEIQLKDKYSDKYYDCELYINHDKDEKSDSIVYDENMGGFIKNTYFVEEQEDGKFLVKIKGKYKYDSNGTRSCELLFSSKDEFLEKKEPIEISLYDEYERRRMIKNEYGRYDLFSSERLTKWNEESPEWSEEIKENDNLDISGIWKGWMIFPNSPIMKSATLTIDDFDKRFANAIKNGMESIPKKVVDIMCEIHPEVKDLIYNTSNEELIKSNDDESR